MNIFNEVNKQIKESKERWVEIDKLVSSLTSVQGQTGSNTQEVLISLVLLLVDQLRPLQASMGQAENMQKEINDMLGSISKMAGK